MSSAVQLDHFMIGWDVGGWNCDDNIKSRDAIVILNSEQKIVGTPWRGNLRVIINDATDTQGWLEHLFELCKMELPGNPIRATLAIDTPLGFSQEFAQLVTRLDSQNTIGQSDTNTYLFRQTERFLFDHGLKPLSAIKDMIGSQATKGMHVLARFSPKMVQCGVWTDGDVLTAIEAYPSACKKSQFIQESLQPFLRSESIDSPMKQWTNGIDHQDKLDALICALVAHTFTFQPDVLASPPDSIPEKEGWIWVPKDGLQHDMDTRVLID